MLQPKLKDIRVDKAGTDKIRLMMAGAEKIKITINLDADILATVRGLSQSSGIPYQTLINRVLREALSKREEQDDRLSRIEKELSKLKKQVGA
jgi:predicted DNA binding CopG/RHH family protein